MTNPVSDRWRTSREVLGIYILTLQESIKGTGKENWRKRLGDHAPLNLSGFAHTYEEFRTVHSKARPCPAGKYQVVCVCVVRVTCTLAVESTRTKGRLKFSKSSPAPGPVWPRGFQEV
jgi:hypothetical protein